eukprot:12932961-Prorocentrum_lima.AAC.1
MARMTRCHGCHGCGLREGSSHGTHTATVCLAGWGLKALRACLECQKLYIKQRAINPALTSEVQWLLAQAASINPAPSE